MNENLIIVIGRGHSGTRAIAKALYNSGVYMGPVFNGDPLDYVFPGCRIIKDIHKMSLNSVYLNDYQWDFSKFVEEDIPEEFITSLNRYLKPILENESPYKGWKLPEFNLVYPYLVRLFPDSKFIHWTRNPLDNILQSHTTDNLQNVEFERRGRLFNRAVSWKYQFDIVEQTSRPKNFLRIKLEDYVRKPKLISNTLSGFLGFDVKMPPPKPEVVGRWQTTNSKLIGIKDLLRDDLETYGYPKLYL